MIMKHSARNSVKVRNGQSILVVKLVDIVFCQCGLTMPMLSQKLMGALAH